VIDKSLQAFIMLRMKMIYARADDGLVDALKQCAADDHRTQSDLMRHALIVYLTEHGYIQKPAAVKPAPKKRKR
jgi:predicted transcriptional regulator